MMTTNHTIEPTTYGLSPVDAAILMKKYVVLLGMINFGTADQKRLAKTEINELEKNIHIHINSSAFEMAQRNLGISEEEINAFTQ